MMKNNIKLLSKLVVLFTFSFLFISLSDAQVTSSKIIIEGKTYYLYKVQPGEGLYRISKEFGVSQKEIAEVNPEVANGLKAGQLIKIPVISGRNSNEQELTGSGKFIYHTVEKGQTVFFISQKYHVSEDVIFENNPGSRQRLMEGTIIKIPVDKIEKSSTDTRKGDFVMHKVRSKETLYGLSKKYHVTQKNIIDANPALKGGVLPVGTLLRIPVVSKELNRQQTANKETAGDQVYEDNNYEYYKIQPGETLYSISRKFKANVKAVKQANRGVNEDDLPVGYMLRIPKESIGSEKPKPAPQGPLFKKHKVKRKETLYSISKKYNVDVDVLKKVNADVNVDKLKRGMIMKIPTQAWFEQEKKQKETVVKTVVPKVIKTVEDSLAYADCISYNYSAERPTLKIGLLLPFNVYESKKVNIITEVDDNGEEIEKEREDKIISNKSKVFVEFYEGMLMALDTLKKEDANIELFVYDTHSDSTDKIKDILMKPEMADLDMIIGPAYAINLQPVSEFARKHDIKLIYPFSTINPELKSNPEIFQVSPVDTLLFPTIESEILKHVKGKRIIMIRTKDNSAYENKLGRELKEQIFWDSFRGGAQPDYVEYKFVQGELNGLEELFVKDVENVVLIPSKNEAYVSSIVTTIAGITRNHHLNVTLWGLPDWLRFQSLKPEDVHQLNGHIFSYYGMDYNNPETITFVNKFRSWYHTEPMAISPYFQKASVRSNFSRYGVWGYDVSYYFINALKTYGKNFEYCLDGYNPHLIQSNFRFKHISNWGGLYNTGLFILNFSPDFKLHIQKVAAIREMIE